MKDQVAANAVAIASLAREGFEPAGDLIFAATADEEIGEGVDYGLAWLCARASGRGALRLRASTRARATGSRSAGGCSTSARPRRRRSSPFVLRVHGRSGHGSMPGIADNALVKAARLIERLGDVRAGAEARRRRRRAFSKPSRTGSVPPDEALGARARDRPGGGGAGRAAARDDGGADDDRGVAEAERHSRALRGDGRLPASARPDAGRGRSGRPRRGSARATTSSSGARRPGRDALGAGHAARGRRSRSSSG